MSRTTKRFLLAYFFLVVLPLIGLIGVLKSGRDLTAPVSVDGVWNLKVDTNRLASLPCARFLATAENPVITISQSGEKFTLSGPRASGPGVIDGIKLRAALPGQAGESGCGSDQQLTLLATVDPKANPRSLAGTLSVDGCSSCSPVEFHAARQTPVKRGAR